jgi:CBS domain-containing protein
MKIKQVMTPDVTVVGPTTAISEIAKKMRDEDIGATPVVENERLIGVVTDRDIVIRVVAAERDSGSATARDAMSAKLLYCFDDQSVQEVLANMGANQVRRLPVVNREKRLVGVVSLGDLAKAAEADAGRALEKISRAPHEEGAPQPSHAS